MHAQAHQQVQEPAAAAAVTVSAVPPRPPAPKGKAPPPKGKAPPPPKAKAGLQRPASSELEFKGPKLRPFFWTSTKVAEETVWEELAPPAPFDPTVLERHFMLQPTRAQPTARKPSGQEEARKRLRVLDDKASQLLAIAFSRLPAPELLAGVLRSLDGYPECLHAEAVLSLHTAATEQETAIRQLVAMGPQEVAQLDLPERYLWVLGTVPECPAKLACGALLVGPARELKGLCTEADLVSACCREFRHNRLVKRCISTSLAIGNVLNRGTARGQARAVVLPDSLLKLEELRGAADGAGDEAAPGGHCRGISLLDFVAQALVEEPGMPSAPDLRAEAEILLARTLAAKSVSLDEAAAHCQQVRELAARALEAVRRAGPALGALSARVQHVWDEVEAATGRMRSAQEELANAQSWSSAKPQGVGGEGWFASWGQFWEQLAQALGRVQLAKAGVGGAAWRAGSRERTRSREPPAEREPLSEVQVQVPKASAGVQLHSSKVVLKSADVGMPTAAAAPPQPRKAQPRQLDMLKLDDNARAEDMQAFFSQLKSAGAGAGAPPEVAVTKVTAPPRLRRGASEENRENMHQLRMMR